jgi:hypothetical protein
LRNEVESERAWHYEVANRLPGFPVTSTLSIATTVAIGAMIPIVLFDRTACEPALVSRNIMQSSDLQSIDWESKG